MLLVAIPLVTTSCVAVLPTLFPAATGTGIKVAIIDTGIDLDHPDLDANVAGGTAIGVHVCDPTAIPGDEGGDPCEVPWEDDMDHGTFVAGIVGAEKGNQADNLPYNKDNKIGVAPEVNLYAVKVFSYFAPTWTSDIIAAIDWAVANGMDVINMSLGIYPDARECLPPPAPGHGSAAECEALLAPIYGPGVGTAWFATLEALQDAIDAAVAAGIVVVAAAGNDAVELGPFPHVTGTCNAWLLATWGYTSTKGCFNSPASHAGVIAVAATHMSDGRAIFTNFGTDIDITAPGDEVISTDVPEIDYQSRFHDDGSGTSFSSPYVAGVAALLKSIGYVDPAAIEAQLEATADAGVVYDTFRTAVVPEPLLDAEEAVLGTEEGDN